MSIMDILEAYYDAAPRPTASLVLADPSVSAQDSRRVGREVTGRLVSLGAVSRGIETIFLSADDDAVVRIYERVGFTRVETACIAGAPHG